MCDDQTTRHTITSNEQFVDQLMATYPAANSVAQAWLMAAQDGLRFQQAVENDLECYIRTTVRDEIGDEESIEGLRSD